MCTVHCVLCPLSIHVKYRRFSLQGTGEGLGQTFDTVVSRLDRREGAVHRLVVQHLPTLVLVLIVCCSLFKTVRTVLQQYALFETVRTVYHSLRTVCYLMYVYSSIFDSQGTGEGWG